MNGWVQYRWRVMAQAGDTYNRGGFIAFMFSMVFSLLFFVYVGLMHPGVDLKEVPQDVGVDQSVAGGQPSAAPKFDPSKVEKPWVSNEAIIGHGQKVYKMNCAACHGAEGMGDGPAGATLKPAPRNLVKGEWTLGGTSVALFKTLKAGIPGTSMVGFGHLSIVDRWAMVHYIRSITEDKPEDDQDELGSFAPTAK